MEVYSKLATKALAKASLYVFNTTLSFANMFTGLNRFESWKLLRFSYTIAQTIIKSAMLSEVFISGKTPANI